MDLILIRTILFWILIKMYCLFLNMISIVCIRRSPNFRLPYRKLGVYFSHFLFIKYRKLFLQPMDLHCCPSIYKSHSPVKKLTCFFYWIYTVPIPTSSLWLESEGAAVYQCCNLSPPVSLFNVSTDWLKLPVSSFPIYCTGDYNRLIQNRFK